MAATAASTADCGAVVVAQAEVGTGVVDPDLPRPVGELACIVRTERLVHLTELVLRRTPLVLLEHLTDPRLKRIGEIVA